MNARPTAEQVDKAETLTRARALMRDLTDTELEKLLDICLKDPLLEEAQFERQRRQLLKVQTQLDQIAKPKWIEWAILVATVLATLIGLISLWRSWK